MIHSPAFCSLCLPNIKNMRVFCEQYTTTRTLRTRNFFSRVAQVAAFRVVSKTISVARMSCFALCFILHRSHQRSALRPLSLSFRPNRTNLCAPQSGLFFGRFAEQCSLTLQGAEQLFECFHMSAFTFVATSGKNWTVSMSFIVGTNKKLSAVQIASLSPPRSGQVLFVTFADGFSSRLYRVKRMCRQSTHQYSSLRRSRS